MGARSKLRSVRRRVRISPRTPPGTAPGTLVSDLEAPQPVVSVMAYTGDELIEQTVSEPKALRDMLERWTLVWVNVNGLGDAGTIQAIGEIFGLNALALEDVLNTNQRPKLEEFPDLVFIVARMPSLEEDGLFTEQLSLCIGSNFVITFQERSGDCFDPVRKRIRESRRIRFLQPDYLGYALLDAVVDSYFPVLEALGERLDGLEEAIAANPDAAVVTETYRVRHDLLALRRSIWPERDVLNSLVRDPIVNISDATRAYFRDCYDHAVRIIDLVETYRELASGLTELYQSSVSHRMNEVMKVLTVIATLFIPLTFIAGIYGMNFNTEVSPWNLPELNWYWGYPAALAAMVILAVAMLIYFRRKGWIG